MARAVDVQRNELDPSPRITRPSHSLLLGPGLTPPSSVLFPYTTLFRSSSRRVHYQPGVLTARHIRRNRHRLTSPNYRPLARRRNTEPTSELQSRPHLLYRLLRGEDKQGR